MSSKPITDHPRSKVPPNKIRRASQKLSAYQGKGLARVSSSDVIAETSKDDKPPTTYLETLMHLLKGNIGTGCFGMADAMKNGGLILGPIFTVILAVICTHIQHVLVRCAENIQTTNSLDERPDFATTVHMSFSTSKKSKLRRWAGFMRITCNVFICLTQLGFCCVYIVFVGQTVVSVLAYYGHDELSPKVIFLLVAIPIWMTTMIRQLKFIAIFSGIANICMILGVILTVVISVHDLPDSRDRKTVGEWGTLPLFFGTALFAFEGIALVLPLKNAMKKPSGFSKTFGVLNVGMVIVTMAYLLIGVIGYIRFGEDIKGSVTLNLPMELAVSQATVIIVAIGILLGYAIQFFIPIQILFEPLSDKYSTIRRHPIKSELALRTLLVIVTLAIAELIPNIALLLSLIGSVCCVMLAFVFPVISELILLSETEDGVGWLTWTKDGIILLIAFAGFIFGGGSSIKEIVEQF